MSKSCANMRSKQLVFLCGARDFHAFDWYRSALKAGINPRPILLTDIIAGESFPRLVGPTDRVVKLLLLDNFLLRSQSTLGNIWRNYLKALVFPIQLVLVRLYAHRHPNSIYYAHSMYYIWLAWASGILFVGTPQGSDILLKPYKSIVFWFLSQWSMRAALFITVDSSKMAKGVKAISGVTPFVIQNGIDLQSLQKTVAHCSLNHSHPRNRIVSFRGLTPLYRIRQIIIARNLAETCNNIGIDFVYPFSEEAYLNKIHSLKSSGDTFWGRIERADMYSLFYQSLLCVSIPYSDSSPRSVYEAIFCGAPVAVTEEDFIYDLPSSMRKRLIVVSLDDPHWLDSAVKQAHELRSIGFTPCEEALTNYDQLSSFNRLYLLSLHAKKNSHK